MRKIRRTDWLLFAASIAGLTGAAFAADPTPQEMLKQIQQLQTKVADLEAKQASTSQPANATSSSPAATPSPTAVSGAVQADADHRGFFFDISNPLTAGYDPGVGFTLRSEDGNFSFTPHALIAVRNETSYRSSIPNKGGGETNETGYDTQNGFEVTRLRLVLQGNFTHQLTYFVQFSADQGASLGLVDAYGTYRFGQSPFALKVGQFKDPLWHERNLSEGNLMAVDRTMVEDLLGGEGTANSRVQGVSFIYDQNRLRAQVVAHDGFSSINSKFFDTGGIGAGVTGASGVTPDNFGFSTREEFLVIGQRTPENNAFSQYDSGFTSLGARQNTLIIGGGADITQAGSNDLLLHTVDAQFNAANGWSAYAAYLGTYRDLHANQGVAPGHYYDPGFVVQLADLVTDKIEPFIRYDYTFLTPQSTTGLTHVTVQELTLGANYYIVKQNVKFTVDGSWLPVGSPVDADNLGILKDNGHAELVLRAQLQLAI